jgi:regulation of enolase protein 1 (concanavalin A-like superfamily)
MDSAGQSESSFQTFHSDNFVLNPPATSHTISADGTKITIRALPKTDWWRLPPPDSVDSRTGAFYGLTIDATRNFSASVWIRGEWGLQFDQGCLMVLAGNSDDVKGDWIKAGVEVETGEEYIG